MEKLSLQERVQALETRLGVPVARKDLGLAALTLLADDAQSLMIEADAAADAPALLRDGSAIQRTVAEHHGVRRHAQGWTEASVRREFEILREEVEREIRSNVPTGAGDVDAAIGVIGRVIERGLENSIGAFLHAEQSRES